MTKQTVGLQAFLELFKWKWRLLFAFDTECFGSGKIHLGCACLGKGLSCFEDFAPAVVSSEVSKDS